MRLNRRGFLGVVGTVGLSGCIHETSVEDLSDEELHEIAEELVEEASEDEVFVKAGWVDSEVDVLDEEGGVDISYHARLNRIRYLDFEVSELLSLDVRSVTAREVEPEWGENESYHIGLEVDAELLADFVNAQFDEERFGEDLELLEYPEDPEVEVSASDLQDASVSIHIYAQDREYVRVSAGFGEGGLGVVSESEDYVIRSNLTPVPELSSEGQQVEATARRLGKTGGSAGFPRFGGR